MDIQCENNNKASLERGTSVPGSCSYVPGGVGRNMCETLGALALVSSSRDGLNVHMHSQIGDDFGRKMVEQLQRELKVDVKDVRTDFGTRTSTVVALLDARDGDNELFACVADVADVEIPLRNVNSSSGTRFVVCDANLSEEALRNVVNGKDPHHECVFFEPTSVAKSVKIASIVDMVDATSPNAKELREMANALRRKLAPGSPPVAMSV